MERKLQRFLTTSFILFIFSCSTFLAQSGGIKGKILDNQTKDPLPYANIVFIGTGFGASTDFEGNYILRNIPVGNYNVKVSYIGYKPIELKMEILSNKIIEKDFRLAPESVEGMEDVVITAQAQGQQHAINAQLNSTSVKSVVSSAKIQELPDANAAESVSRLPGISLIRTGGEGSQVVVRGLSPQYNQITIDGVELSGNVPSGSTDRGTDLSMISSNMLGSIEVIKAITPDMDATAIGGVVNFGMRKASKNLGKNRTSLFNNYLSGVELISQGSYNGLKSAYGDYKLVGSLEKRFFDEKFGVFIQGNVEEKNLSSNILGVGYVLEDKTHGDDGIPLLENMSLTDVHRIRNRYGGTITFDYEHSTGDIGFMNFISISDTKETNRSESFPSDAGRLTYSINNDPFTLVNYSNLLSIKQDISIFQADIKFSHSYSEREAPGTTRFNFPQPNAVEATMVPELRKMHPKELATYMNRSAQSAYLLSIGYENNITEDRTYTSSADFSTDLNLSEFITSKIKFGGAYQYRNRSYDREYWYGSMFDDGQTVALALAEQLNMEPITLGSGGPLKTLSYYDFISSDYDYGKFLKGDYELGEPADLDLILKAADIARANTGDNPAQVGFKKQIASSRTSDYTGSEIKSAGYIMASINFGTQITLTPGVRYQNLTTEYTGSRGLALIAGDLQDTVVTEKLSHGYLLPMVHLKYKPFNWFQIHFAYTNTLNYPAFSRITPRYLVGQNSISYNNFRLKPAKSENFDLAFSVFNNEIGLFTINGFNKNISDLIFSAGARYPTKDEIAEDYPEIPVNFVAGRSFYTYINNPHEINVYGVEIDWQTHFWYLPGPLSGIVFNINYTHIFSDAKYPRTERHSLGFDPTTGTEKYVYIDTFYVARLLDQPKDILNLSIGYDYGGFSSRLSAFYQDNVFKEPNFWLQERTHSDKYFRLDLSVKQKLPWYGIQVYFNLNNITAEQETDLNQKTSYPAAQRHYGMSGDLGIKLQL